MPGHLADSGQALDDLAPNRPWRLRPVATGPSVVVRPATPLGRKAFGGTEAGSVFGPVRFGRASDNDVVLEDPTVSAHHARFYLKAGSLWVEDMKSTNGTVVNGTRIAQAFRLRPGDRIIIGTNTFEVTR